MNGFHCAGISSYGLGFCFAFFPSIEIDNNSARNEPISLIDALMPGLWYVCRIADSVRGRRGGERRWGGGLVTNSQFIRYSPVDIHQRQSK